jgi:hypothetical protein
MTLIEKLKTRAGTVAVINAPKSLLPEFKAFKPAVSIPAGAKRAFDFVLLFATQSKKLESAWKRIIPALKDDAIFWAAYPKKSSGIASDLTRMSGDGSAIHSGSPWQPVMAVSIDDTWTGTRYKFAPHLESERRNRATEEIRDTDGTLVVDRINRAVHPPKDWAAILAKHPEARIFFDRLSFTNQREYVTWIVESKKSETRMKRLTSALEKIVSGKKNPSEK